MRCVLYSIVTIFALLFNGLMAEEETAENGVVAQEHEIQIVSSPSIFPYVSGSCQEKGATLDMQLELRKGLIFENTHETSIGQKGLVYKVNFVADGSIRFMSDDGLFQLGTFTIIVQNDPANQCILWEVQEMKQFKDEQGCTTTARTQFKGKIPSARLIKHEHPYGCFCGEDQSTEVVSFFFQ